jgi:hypothetical protein
LVNMEDNKEQEKSESLDSTEIESLDTQTTVVTDGATTDATSTGSEPTKDGKKEKKKRKAPNVKGLAGKFNIYLLLFIFIMVIAGIVTFISYQQNKNAAKKANQTISTTPLSEEDLNKLRQTDVKVGDPKQILSVESNAIFAGKVLIRDSLEVAGQIKVGGPLNLPGISVSGTSVFDQVQISNLQVSGAVTIEGQLNVQSGLNVTGNLSVGGTISAGRLNIDTLSVNKDLQLSRHIDAGGGTPGSSGGGALGGGGTASVSGTDTAGTININTGGGAVAGCFITVNFTQSFSSPHLVVTPVGFSAGAINYYINRSNSNFSLCTSNNPPSGTNFAFDYIVID